MQWGPVSFLCSLGSAVYRRSSIINWGVGANCLKLGWAFQMFVQGSAFWTGKMLENGEVQVHGEGDQKGHWDFMGLIDDGLVQPFDPSYVP